MSSRSIKMVELAQDLNSSRGRFCEVKKIITTTTSAKSDDNNSNNNIEKNVDFESTSSSDFDSDNFVADPDFVIPECENLSLLGEQIESELLNSSLVELENTSPKPKKNKKCDSQQIRTKKRNTGQSYEIKTRKIPARKFIPLTNNCKKKCKDKLSICEQQKLFDSYWKLGSYNQRILFISSLIIIEETKTETKIKHLTKPRQRLHHIRYQVHIEKKILEICQRCFRQCFCETESFLKSVVKKKLSHPNLEIKDHRGGTNMIKISDVVIDKVKSHINSFPLYESHYTRRDTSLRYLHANLSITKMYNLFLEMYPEIKISLIKYIEIFKTMKIKFKKPQLDSCSRCDLLKSKIDVAKRSDVSTIQLLQNELSEHHRKSDFAYEVKKSDKLLSLSNKSIRTFTFDLQQCLPTPLLHTSTSFYKRQLWTYNLTIHDCLSNSPYCYMWHEGIAKRGGNDIASCLLKHLQYIDNHEQVNHVIFYSDSCFGQNKNSFVSTMFATFIQSSNNIKIIDHKFLEPGHTHMECDTDHALIERKKKRTDAKIHHPRDWYNFVSTVGIKNKFNVIEMMYPDFKNFSSFSKSKFMWRNRSENSTQFIWKEIRWLRYVKEYFGKIHYKNSLNESDLFEILNIQKRGVSKAKVEDIPIIEEKNKISFKKKKDLESILPLIDPSFHNFYKSLETDELPDIHPDLIEDDFEETNN